MEQIVEFPDVLKLVKENRLPDAVYAPDGTLLIKPYDSWTESPLIVNRKAWRLFANYTVLKDTGKYVEVKVNTTGQIIRISDADAIDMMGFIRLDKPGATVEEAISRVLQIVVEQTGDFKDEEEFGAYTFSLYFILAYLIGFRLLVLVR